MRAKNRWDRLPEFIWGDGSVGIEQGADRYTDTRHLVHARFPRFVCSFEELGEQYAGEPETRGPGAEMEVRAAAHRFFGFVFLDPAPDRELIAGVCNKASICRLELDAEDERAAATGGTPQASEESELDAAALALEQSSPDEVEAALPYCFPDGWTANWLPRRPVDAVHCEGHRVERTELGVRLVSPSPVPDVRLVLLAQGERLLLGVSHEYATAKCLVALKRSRGAPKVASPSLREARVARPLDEAVAEERGAPVCSL